MDDNTLEGLRGALAAGPQNLELRLLLVRGLLDRKEAEEAAQLVEEAEAITGEEARTLAARALFEAGRPETAVDYADGEGGQAQLLRARILLALDRRDEGIEAYRQAVAANPALEDLELRNLLGSRVREFPGKKDGDGERPRLRVISNDDTDDVELDRLLHPSEEVVDFSDVGGLDGIKKQIRKRIILPFQKPSLFQRFKKRVGGGILLYGPPGCGKTLLARATAGECDATFFNIAISDVLDMYIGESERKLHALFERARESTPAVLFFDELEGLGGKRMHTREATSAKLVSQFLAEMDGFSQNNQGVLILAATNVPWAVDPAFRRPGRFDRLLFVPPPDRGAREAILGLELRDRPMAPKLDLGAIARKTPGFSGADLRELVETASDGAIEESLEHDAEVPISQKHLKEALDEVRATTLEWLTTARNYARYANEGGQYDEVLRFLKDHGK